MDKKSLIVIQDAINHACDTIRNLAWENYPYDYVQDEDLGKMFLAMTEMSINISKKLEG